MTAEQDELVTAAKEYRAQGLIPIPMTVTEKASKWEKQPRVAHWTPYRDGQETMTDAVIEKVFRQRGVNAVAVIVGKGMAVVDLDGDQAIKRLSGPLLKATRCDSSSRPGGMHGWLLTKTPMRKRSDILADGVELKGAGHLAVVPPSLGRKWLNDLEPLTVPDAVAWGRAFCQEHGVKPVTEQELGERVFAGETITEQRWLSARRFVGVFHRYGADEGLIHDILTSLNDKGRFKPPLEDQRIDDLAKAVAKLPAEFPDLIWQDGETPAGDDEFVDLTKAVPRELPKHWGGRFVEGTHTMLVGEPESGKSTLMLDLATRVSKGDYWPLSDERAPLGDVIILSSEDDPESVILPKLKAMGADLSRVHPLRLEVPFDISQATRLAGWMRRFPDAKLIEIDPILSFTGKLDVNAPGIIRPALEALARAAPHCIILGLSHLNKQNDLPALTRILGSTDFRALARSILANVHWPPDQLHFYALHLKYSYGKRKATVSYNVEGPEGAGYIVWESEHPGISEIEQLSEGSREAPKLDDAKELLQELLSEGTEVPQRDVDAAARERGITMNTLNRAKKELGITSRHGEGGIWYWRLPPQEN